MTRMDYLRDQANRAERLAYTVTDALTVQRLASFAAACRREMLAEKNQLTAYDHGREPHQPAEGRPDINAAVNERH
jgi:hypothetical protein